MRDPEVFQLSPKRAIQPRRHQRIKFFLRFELRRAGGVYVCLQRVEVRDDAALLVERWHGQWFVQNDLVRDFLAFNKIELLPWDGWGLMAGPEDVVSPAALTLLDRIAALTIDPAAAFDDIRALYEHDTCLHTRPEWWG